MAKSYNPLKSWMAWIGFVLGLIVLAFSFVSLYYLIFLPIEVIAIPALILLSLGASLSLILLPVILFFVGYGIHLAFNSSKKLGWIILIAYIIASTIGTIIYNRIFVGPLF
ncbi:hypothetical protein COU60_03370 [Candidatus Pacearchaeota archaeon CG10_big_fil_rev_8_21_14_0_10_34_76]|nr:MAG: hypothetical protein COU60_03370 [Candidatus Pacearchaeota archaeon CG10_big_fil_rev_8_21_14_0_10_34_76]